MALTFHGTKAADERTQTERHKTCVYIARIYTFTGVPMFKFAVLSIGLCLGALATPSPATQSPAIAPAPAVPSGVTMPLSRIEVQILDGVATTTLRQTIRNNGTRDAEAAWLLPLPEGAVTDGFTMTMNGVATTGAVLNADQARSVYEGIVRKRKDPGLLRYVGRGCLQANIFPVPPGGDVEVTVTYQQILPQIAGLTCWSLPSADAGLAGRAPGLIELELSIESTRANLANVFSPNGQLHVVQTGERVALGSLESTGARVDELQVFYGLDQTEFALDMLSYRAPGEKDGTFVLMVSPRQEWSAEEIAKKELTFVVDVSGSMSGTKIKQAQGALDSFLGSLNSGDRFNVIPFSTSADKFFPKPVEATFSNIQKARERVTGLVAAGGTNIASAMQAALDSKGTRDAHIPITVFLTDGLPTVGQRDTLSLLNDVRQWNTNSTRVFVLGVGNDVNAPLLDQMAADGRGTRSYVRPDEDIEIVASDLFQKLSHPVMSDLGLSIDGVRVSSMSPEILPDLFVGQRLIVVGRYEGDTPAQVTLTGTVAGELRAFETTALLAVETDQRFSFVPSLWAERRIAVLLDLMRLEGKVPELYDEVVRLGSKYNIVTPYTSHLILEKGMDLAGVPGGAHRPVTGTPMTGAPSSHGGTYRGPGNTVPPSGGGGGGGGPASPGSPGPTSGASAAPRTGSGGWFLGGGQGGVQPADLSMPQLIERLVEMGVLPDDASEGELAKLAAAIAAELRA
ncbi:MAG: VIT domain-containing protein, partial [Planctomycetota bacterium]|nr:VIT domain-containing protein [Planctomycetota bacterium]